MTFRASRRTKTKNCFEHAHWTFKASRKSRTLFPGKTKSLEHARWTLKASRKPNSAKVTSYCKTSKAVFTKRLSCVAQVTQGAYIDVVFVFPPPTNREFKHRGPNANFEYLWEKVEPIHPLSDKVFERPGL